MSGLAAAERIGADYPFTFDPLATDQFDTYFSVAHGARRRNRNDKGAADKDRAAHERAVQAAAGVAPHRETLLPSEVTTTKWFPPGWEQDSNTGNNTQQQQEQKHEERVDMSPAGDKAGTANGSTPVTVAAV